VAEHGPFPIEQLQVWLPPPAPRIARFLDCFHRLLVGVPCGSLGGRNLANSMVSSTIWSVGRGEPSWFSPISGISRGILGASQSPCSCLFFPRKFHKMPGEWRFSPLIFVLRLPNPNFLVLFTSWPAIAELVYFQKKNHWFRVNMQCSGNEYMLYAGLILHHR
jgi:hypothetical protein